MAKTLDVELLGLTHAQLIPAPDNLRGTLTDISELADSIESAGVLQPLRVMPHPVKANRWEIIAGHRRHAAIGKLIAEGRWRKTDPIPCVTAEGGMEDVSRLQAMLIENLQRVDLDPLEEALGYKRLQEECGRSVRDIAGMVGRSKSVISSRAQLLKLPEFVRAKVTSGELPLELAYKLCQLDPDTAERLVRRPGPSLTMRDVEVEISAEKVAKFRSAAHGALEAVGVEVSTKLEWQMGKQYGYELLHHHITPTAVGKLLLPDDRSNLVAWLHTHASVLAIDIFRYTPPVNSSAASPSTSSSSSSSSAGTPARPEPRLMPAPTWDETPSPVARARQEWQTLRVAANAAVNEALEDWRRAHHQVLLREAKAAAIGAVGVSAVMFICEWFSGEDGYALATELGFDPEVDDQEAAFSEWLLEPANAAALAAMFMLSDGAISPMFEAANGVPDKVAQECGPMPRNPWNDLCPSTHAEALAMYRATTEDHPGRAEAIEYFERREAERLINSIEADNAEAVTE